MPTTRATICAKVLSVKRWAQSTRCEPLDPGKASKGPDHRPVRANPSSKQAAKRFLWTPSILIASMCLGVYCQYPIRSHPLNLQCHPTYSILPRPCRNPLCMPVWHEIRTEYIRVAGVTYSGKGPRGKHAVKARVNSGLNVIPLPSSSSEMEAQQPPPPFPSSGLSVGKIITTKGLHLLFLFSLRNLRGQTNTHPDKSHTQRNIDFTQVAGLGINING